MVTARVEPSLDTKLASMEVQVGVGTVFEMVGKHDVFVVWNALLQFWFQGYRCVLKNDIDP